MKWDKQRGRKREFYELDSFDSACAYSRLSKLFKFEIERTMRLGPCKVEILCYRAYTTNMDGINIRYIQRNNGQTLISIAYNPNSSEFDLEKVRECIRRKEKAPKTTTERRLLSRPSLFYS